MNNRPSVPLGSNAKPEEPSGAYSETSYIFKSNDESLSFTELLPKLGLSPSLFGLPTVHSSATIQQRPKVTTVYSSHGPVYKVNMEHESTFQPSSSSHNEYNSGHHQTIKHQSSSPSFTEYKSQNHHTNKHQASTSSFNEFNSGHHQTIKHQPQQHQKVAVKSHLHTSIKGDPSYEVNHNNNLAKVNYSHQPVKSSSTRTSSFNKLPNYNFPTVQQSSAPSHSEGHVPTGVIEEVVVGKPVGNIRPSLPHQQQAPEHVIPSSDYSHHEAADTISPFEPHPLPVHHATTATKPTDHSDGIHSSQSDHKFGHITTNYYIPHTIHSESEYKKPFAPSPQVEYFVPQEAHDANHDNNGQQKNQFRNHYVPSEEAKYQQKEEEQRIEYHHHTEQPSKTEDYFLPKLHPAFPSHSGVSPSPSVAHGHSDSLVYQENPKFTSYFKFGTNLLVDSKQGDQRPHSFPRTESSISYGSQFKPKPESSFSAFPTSTVEEQPTAPKTYYTIKEEPIDYNPYKSAPIALLKPHQEEQDFAAKYKAIAQKPQVIHREFTTKVDAENFVKTQIFNAASPAVATIEKRPSKFQYLPSSTAAPLELQNSVHYPDAIYIKGKFPKIPKVPTYKYQSEHIKPVVEQTSDEGHYPLPDTPQFDNAHLDLGLAGSEKKGTYAEPSRPSPVRPSLELKQTIASKKISTDASSSSEHDATNQDESAAPEVDVTTSKSEETNSNNHYGGQLSNHQTLNNHHHHQHSARPASQQQQHRRKQANKNNNQNTLQKNSSNTNQAKDQSETLSEKSSTASPERKRRLNPRQKMIACERQCIQSSVSQEYDPVCGNDGKTYSNKGKLTCTQKCGKDGEWEDDLGGVSS